MVPGFPLSGWVQIPGSASCRSWLHSHLPRGKWLMCFSSDSFLAGRALPLCSSAAPQGQLSPLLSPLTLLIFTMSSSVCRRARVASSWPPEHLVTVHHFSLLGS